MGLFSKDKKNKDEFFQSLEEDVQKSREESFMKLSDFSRQDSDRIEYLKTAFNIENKDKKDDNENTDSPLDSIIKKVSKDGEASKENVVYDEQSEPQNTPEPSTIAEQETKENKPDDNYFLISNDNISEDTEELSFSPENIQKPEKPVRKPSLLERCRAYTKDDNGNDVSANKKPLYELKSVSDILKNSEFDAVDKLSKKYNIVIQDETDKPKDIKIDIPKEENPVEAEPIKFEKLVEESKEAQKSDDEIFEEYFLEQNSEITEKITNESIPDISDVDNKQKISQEDIITPATDETVRFTPVGAKDKKYDIASITSTFDFNKILDISGDEKNNNQKINTSEFDQSEFEEIVCENEVSDFNSIRHLIKKLSFKKRNSFLASVISLICVLTVGIFFISPLSNLLLTDIKLTTIICLASLCLNIVVNFRIFVNIFTKPIKYITADLSAAVSSVFLITLSALQLKYCSLEYAEDVHNIIFLGSIILFFRALSQFWRYSSILGNLKQISSDKIKKKALSFIDDESVTFAMAKNSIDSDVLLAACRETDFIDDFVKYSDHNILFGGKFYIIQLVAFLLAVLIGLVSSIYYKDTISVFYCATAIICIFSLPCLYFINTLSSFHASKRLNPIGAMINGSMAAEKIERTNAVTISTSEIFPAGTIILKDLKILSDSNIDDIILRATSLTEAVNSPLHPLFKKIAKTTSDYQIPDSDSVKYEDRLGLSGWVDNELLFIGNRSLMMSHGIDLPDMEVDKRILNKGCFPIYLATVDKACALLVVEYVPIYEISKQLRNITNLGVTVLLTNSDQNINEEMISDYFGVYEDSVKIVSNAGNSMLKNAVTPTERISSPASFKRNNLSLLYILNAASSIKKSNLIFSVFYIVGTILLSTAFIYLGFASKSSVPSSGLLLISELVITALSLIIYLFKKP